MSVPINVTARIPITTPNAVKRDLILLARTDVMEILKFSINKENIMPLRKYLLLLFHLIIEWFDGHA